MELELQKLSIMLLDPTITDQQLTDELLFLKDFAVRSVFVLPYNVGRAKQLLAGTKIQIGSYADFPLGGGTLAKKAFETGKLYREGASEVCVAMTPDQLTYCGQQSYQNLAPLSFGHNRLGFFIDSSQLNEQQKQQLTMDLSAMDVNHVSLGLDLTMEEAIYDMSIFRMGRKNQRTFQVNVKAPTLLEIELLFQAGASQIGLSNGEILPLISKWD
ncbi:deoxyribose-phosphate aldolase [Enterococcus termitis]